MIKVLHKADRVLWLVANREVISFTDIQNATGFHKSTLSNLLKSLVELGLLRRDDQGLVRTGHRLATLAERDVLAGRLSGIAVGAVRGIGVRLQGRVVMAVLKGAQRHILADYEPASSLRVSADGYDDLLLYSTSTGRILLAFATRKQRDLIVDTQGLPDRTWWPEGGSKTTLFKALDAIKAQGHVFVRNPDGLTEMTAVPVCYPDGSFCGGVGVATPSFRMDAARRKEFLDVLKTGAEEMREVMETFGITGDNQLARG